MDKQTMLEQIKAEIAANNVCPNLAQTATQLVMGDGNPDADIVFIGEAPGKKEDEQGVPFVGAAGRFLNEMLASVEMKRSDIYITNIVKYRPPNNRDPLPEEKQEFFPYLLRQLVVIEPKVIVPLGRHSMGAFLPGMQISAVHGRAYRRRLLVSSWNDELIIEENDGGVRALPEEAGERTRVHKEYSKGVPEFSTKQGPAKNGGVSGAARKQTILSTVIIPLYHPAAALYNGGLRQTLLDDFAKIPIIIQSM